MFRPLFIFSERNKVSDHEKQKVSDHRKTDEMRARDKETGIINEKQRNREYYKERESNTTVDEVIKL